MTEKILITVKTYPTLSQKYAELVCTAGVTEDGEWRRLYPIQFRQLCEKYNKYQWVTAKLTKSTTNPRPESFKIAPHTLSTIGDPLPSKDNWRARRESFLDMVKVHDDLQDLIARAHRNELSLAAFRPKRILRFSHEAVEREWDPEKLAILEKEKNQQHLFKDSETVAKELRIVNKLPYKFSYQFEEASGKKRKLMIEDWEIGALYWNCLKNSEGDETLALAKVKQKYWDEFVLSGKFEITLILGTTLERHNKKAPNPFVIISVCYPGVERQKRLF